MSDSDCLAVPVTRYQEQLQGFSAQTICTAYGSCETRAASREPLNTNIEFDHFLKGGNFGSGEAITSSTVIFSGGDYQQSQSSRSGKKRALV